jgi:chromosome segregation ATPase
VKFAPPSLVIGLPVLVLTALAAKLVTATENGTPWWAAEIVLVPFLSWVGIETVRQGRALKRLPTREDIEGWRTEAQQERRRIFEAQDELNRRVADNIARIDGLTQRMDAHRGELDEIASAIRMVGARLEDVKDMTTQEVTLKLVELGDRLEGQRAEDLAQYVRLEARVNEIDHRRRA